MLRIGKQIEMDEQAWKEFYALFEELDKHNGELREGILGYLSYNGEVALEVYNVLRLSEGGNAWYEEIAKKLNLKDTHVELIKYILCVYELLEYGTSPRGAWLTDKGQVLLDKLIKVIEKE